MKGPEMVQCPTAFGYHLNKRLTKYIWLYQLYCFTLCYKINYYVTTND